MFFRKNKTSPRLDLGFPCSFSHPKVSEPEVLLLMAFKALLGFFFLSILMTFWGRPW